MTEPRATDATRLRELIDGYQISKALAVVAELGIADLLADGPKHGDELAREIGVHPGALTRLLRALATIGVFAHEGDDRFALTPLAEHLRSDAAGSLKAMAMQAGHRSNWSAWGSLLHSVQTGESAFRHVHGISAWEYRERDPAAGTRFDDAMAATAQEVSVAILDAYDFAGAGRVVDVGGGRGALLAAILATHPAVRGILFDRPNVVAAAAPQLRAAGVADRCTIDGGDFLERVPIDGDVYVLKGVIHDWPDDAAKTILDNCRQAMGPDASLLVIEQVLPANGTTTPFARFMDLHMLVIHGAGERTAADFAELLATAGFRLTRIIPTETSLSIIEAAPV